MVSKYHLFSYIMCLMLSIVAVVGALNISNTYCFSPYGKSYDMNLSEDLSLSSWTHDVSSSTCTYTFKFYAFTFKNYDTDYDYYVYDYYNDIIPDNFTLLSHSNSYNFVTLKYTYPTVNTYDPNIDSSLSSFFDSLNVMGLVFIHKIDGSRIYCAPNCISSACYFYNNGFDSNYGYEEGYNAGVSDGTHLVTDNPSDYDLVSKNAYDNAYDSGYESGYNDGIDNVKQNPSDYGMYNKTQYIDYGSDRFNQGYSDGYNMGESDTVNGQSTFKNLIFSIIDAPFNVLSNAFNFEIFGINMSYFLIAIVSLLLVFFVIRKLM